MRRVWKRNGLTIVLLLLFVGAWVGQALTGWHEYNGERRDHGRATVGLGEYLTTGHFWEITAENWESEFLQMGMFVVLTCFLFQKGSPESKDPDSGHDPVDDDPRVKRHRADAPWPVRRGGGALWVYERSLGLVFFTLFGISAFLHARHGARAYNEDQLEHGGRAVSAIGYVGTTRFWHESLQNWQSEFLSLAAMVYLSVYLRQRGSAESKAVATPHEKHEDEDDDREERSSADELETVGTA